MKEGQNVAKGQKIAEMGSTDTDQVKLHFEIRRFGKPVDPMKLLPPRDREAESRKSKGESRKGHYLAGFFTSAFTRFRLAVRR